MAISVREAIKKQEIKSYDTFLIVPREGQMEKERK
jgi:hypothetical protein